MCATPKSKRCPTRGNRTTNLYPSKYNNQASWVTLLNLHVAFTLGKSSVTPSFNFKNE